MLDKPTVFQSHITEGDLTPLYMYVYAEPGVSMFSSGYYRTLLCFCGIALDEEDYLKNINSMEATKYFDFYATPKKLAQGMIAKGIDTINTSPVYNLYSLINRSEIEMGEFSRGVERAVEKVQIALEYEREDLRIKQEAHNRSEKAVEQLKQKYGTIFRF